MRNKTIIFLIFAIVFVAGFSYFIFIKNKDNKKDNKQETIENTPNLLLKTDSQAGISFTVEPLDFSFNNPVKFEIKIDTHSGSLDFDLTEISVLEDSNSNSYQPLDWQGSASGGHHRSGVITFPKLSDKTEKIKLIIQDNSDIPPRIFEWDLNI